MSDTRQESSLGGSWLERQRTDFASGRRRRVEEYLAEEPRLAQNPELLVDLVYAEFRLREEAGEGPLAVEYLRRFPQLREQLAPLFEVHSAMQHLESDDASKTLPQTSASAATKVELNAAGLNPLPESIDNPDLQIPPGAEIPTCPLSFERAGNANSAECPANIGRYLIQSILGEGGFGRVYLAYDDQLKRQVAIKVPHSRLVARPEDAELYLAEARTVAGLDHAHIVPVFDVSSTAECPFFIVSKYIEGSDLARKIEHSPFSSKGAAELVATVAEALHYAHKQGLVHRDIKPGNILLGNDGKPYVVDFGLALREENFGQGPRFAGTLHYMSPEQARGEGHRVDGRSDIFSLGIVLYELLVGRRPFSDTNQQSLLEQIATLEPRPPRMIDDSIPKELERICLKALSKRATERYTTARDLAEDLRHFSENTHPAPPVNAESTPGEKVIKTGGPVANAVLDSQRIRIVPKGLRSFDAHDAEFFLELLPGPRDRDGLPDSIRFWKTRIDETDADQTFAVGVIYGPSGCGKSSLVKAGLLPRLSHDVLSLYIEASPDDTEGRLLHALQRKCPGLPENLGLKETVTALRQGEGIPKGKKVLIVLDQFEQWLHARQNEEAADLVQALRQCDGGRVQCIVMVRDDFWTATARFMRELEIQLVEGQNSNTVEFFSRHHARKILAAFGRAYGNLPSATDQISRPQQEFLIQAIDGLAEDGKVTCVRLALFAEMMRGKAWTPAKLREVGGAQGVGVTFLEETFSASTAPPQHRYHQDAARAVLKTLVPELGTDLKVQMRSMPEMLEASGYQERPQDFAELVRILDSELRIITPSDLTGVRADSRSDSNLKYYQLTHDYLVPSLRTWLTRKQKETRRGRAELLLEDRAVVWNARPENRQLPSVWQWFSILYWTSKESWTLSQRKMMLKARRYHVTWGLFALGVLALIVWFNYEAHCRIQAHALRDRLLDADIIVVRKIVEQMTPYRYWIDPLLQEALQESKEEREKLRASLALLEVDETQVEYLSKRLLEATPYELPLIREALGRHKDKVGDKLWSVLENPQEGEAARRLRAAVALARYDPDNLPRFAKAGEQIVSDLLSTSRTILELWLRHDPNGVPDQLQKPLIEKLKVTYPSEQDRERRATAAYLLSTWGHDDWLKQVDDGRPKEKD